MELKIELPWRCSGKKCSKSTAWNLIKKVTLARASFLKNIFSDCFNYFSTFLCFCLFATFKDSETDLSKSTVDFIRQANFSALYDASCRSYLEKLATGDKYMWVCEFHLS